MADKNQLLLFIERVNLRSLLFSVIVAVLGFALMAISSPVDGAGYHKIAALLHEAGAALFISVALAALWDLAGKRAFADEILAKANMSRDLADAGIDMVTPSFRDERVNWEELFKCGYRLDLFVAYAHSWRNTQAERIGKLLANSDSKLRVVLPDPDDAEVLKALSVRFGRKPEVVKQEIVDAQEFYEHRRENAKGIVELYFTSILPLDSFYRFNNKVVFALYNHRAGQQPVPSFVCDQEGFLFKFFSDEFEGILADTRTRRVDPPKT
jgi:hypothetical protein